jgi:collagen type I/II/III/V/XI/XXIV/XXVII alpha
MHRRAGSWLAIIRRSGIHRRRRDRSDAADTLIEVLLAVVLLGIAGVAVLVALETAIMGSAVYRKVATLDTVLKSAAAEATSQIQASATAFACPTPAFSPTLTTPPAGYTVRYTKPEYWTGAKVTAQCKAGEPIFATVTATALGSSGRTGSLSFVVDNPNAPAVVSGTTASKLLFVTLPSNPSVGAQFAPPVAVAIVDTSDNVVTGDISSMSLSLAASPAGGALSATCNPSGVEYYGVFTFSNCSVNKAGTYKIKATDGLLSATTTNITIGRKPTVVVTNNSTVVAPKPLIFTAKVSGLSKTTPTPTGTMTWSVTSPLGVQVACSSTTYKPTATNKDVAIYTCTITKTVQGVYSAAATYPGDSNYQTAVGFDSSAIVTGTPLATSTTLNAITTPITYGSETVEVFSGHVTGQPTSGFPEGTVTVTSGATTLCSATLTSGSGDQAPFTCTALANKKLAASATAYPVLAHYLGGGSSNPAFTYLASTSPSQGLTVNKATELTTTTISLKYPSRIYGSETSEVFTATVTGVATDGYPEGAVTIESATGAAICTASLTGHGSDTSTWTCGLTPSQLTSGSYSVKAHYAGGTSSTQSVIYTTSTSSPATLTIRKTEPTTTSISLNHPTATFGSETTETFTVTVTGVATDGYPQGNVKIEKSTGAGICTATAAGHGTDTATWTCTLGARRLPAGSYLVKAHYTGGTSSTPLVIYTTSTSPTSALTIKKASVTTTTAISLNHPTATYGSETTETFTVTVTGAATDGYPEGTVTIEKSPTNTAVCTATSTGHGTITATWTCTLTARKLTAGSYSVKAHFAPGTPSSSTPSIIYTTSTSSTASLTIRKAAVATTTAISLNHPTATYGSETTETFTVTVTGAPTDGYPEGTVAIEKSPTNTPICTATSTGHGTDTATWTCTLAARKLVAGSYSVKAHFAPGTPSSSTPNVGYTASTSPTASLTIRKASEPTITSISLNHPTATYGSETTETFTAKVTGVATFGYPTGTLTIEKSTGAAICTATLTAHGADTSTFTCTLGARKVAAGSYSVKAHYTGGTSTTPSVVYATSTSTTSPLTIKKASVTTTTAISLNHPTATYGSEATETFTVTVTGAATDGYPEGTVTIEKSPTNTAICTATSTGHGTITATWTCTLTARKLTAGSYSVKAHFAPGTPSSSTPSVGYTTSTSSTASLTIKKASVTTTTTLSLNHPTATYGSETTETFTATVTGVATDGYPEGTVTIERSTGASICAATLSSHGTDTSTWTCTLTARKLTAGSYSVKAHYAPGTPSSTTGNVGYTASTSPTTPLTINKLSEPTSTTISLNHATRTYGSETTETFTVTVTGVATDGYPQGTVTVQKSTGATICTATVTGHGTDTETWTCTLAARKLPAGSYSVKAHYTGGTSSTPNVSYTASTSSTTPLTIKKLSVTTATSISLNHPTAIYGSETSETFTATVTGAPTDGYPEGAVTIEKSTGASVCPATLASHGTDTSTWSCTLTASALTAGSYTLKAHYAPATPPSTTPSVSYGASTSSTASLVVRQLEPTSTTIALNHTTRAYGSETTETFTVKVTGVATHGTPEGSVTVEKSTGTAICTAGLTPHGTDTSTGSCTLTASQLLPGSYTVKATYAGGTSSNANYSYTGSASAATSFKVTDKPCSATAFPVTLPAHTTTSFTAVGGGGGSGSGGTSGGSGASVSGILVNTSATSKTVRVFVGCRGTAGTSSTAGAGGAGYANGGGGHRTSTHGGGGGGGASGIEISRTVVAVAGGGGGGNGNTAHAGTTNLTKKTRSSPAPGSNANASSYGGGGGGATTAAAGGSGTAGGAGGFNYVAAAGTVGTVQYTIRTAVAGNDAGTTGSVTFGARLAPVITSASSATFTYGTAGSFPVTTTSYPTTPTITNAFAGCTNSVYPSSLTFVANGNGTATIASTATTPAGTYTFCVDATDGVAPAANQTFTLKILRSFATLACHTTTTFTVAGRSTLSFTLVGGGGGSGRNGATGGAGADFSGTLVNNSSLTKTVTVDIGCAGGTATGTAGAAGGPGYAAGGKGGAGTGFRGGGGGGGGGASSLRVGSTYVAIAGGGGGGGGGSGSTAGTTVTTTKTVSTARAGHTGTGNGSGGGGGGVTTQAAAGGTHGGGSGGFDFRTASTTVTGVTVTVSTAATGGNAGTIGSLTVG